MLLTIPTVIILTIIDLLLSDTTLNVLWRYGVNVNLTLLVGAFDS